MSEWKEVFHPPEGSKFIGNVAEGEASRASHRWYITSIVNRDWLGTLKLSLVTHVVTCN